MKVYVGSIVYRDVTVQHHQSMLRLEELVANDPNIELQFATVVGDADVGRSRSVAASGFLRSDCDVLLTIDSDIWFQADDALKLCKKCFGGKHVIGGLYVTRSLLEAQPALLLGDDVTVTFEDGQHPVPVQFLATGFMAVHRKVFQKLTEHSEVVESMKTSKTPFWTFYLQKTIPWPGDQYLYLSEDFAFCHRAREMGFEIWLDPAIRLGHMGAYAYRLEDMLEIHFKACPIRLTRNSNGHILAEGLLPEGDEALLPQYQGRVNSKKLIDLAVTRGGKSR